MCAINGFNFQDRKLIEQMNTATKHRGPDGTGVFVDDHITLGHNLLVITEVAEKSKQPFVTNDKDYALIYNGEIYNYPELRKELEKQGDHFETNSDTEVLFKGLLRYGTDFIEKLDGMFAFAWYDKKKQELFLARDHTGMKPLYYYLKDGRFIFSSELRGILCHDIDRILDRDGAAVFFSMGYVPGERTLIKNIFKVPPGQYMRFDLVTKSIENHFFAVRKELKSEEFNPETLRSTVADSVWRHTMGLRPFGLYLSGGLDSSIILHELAQHSAQKINAYTTRFEIDDDRFNEDSELAKRLSKHYGVTCHEILVTEQDYIDTLVKATETIEEPRYNQSIPGYWLTAQRASKDITVVLSGSGGDELFMGYSKYGDSHNISRMFNHVPQFAANTWHTIKMAMEQRRLVAPLRLQKHVDRWMYLTRTGAHPNVIAHTQEDLRLESEELYKYLRDNGRIILDAQDPDIENNIAGFDRLFWLGDEEFLRTDKITMNFSMEGRFPLVAKEVIEYAQRMPSTTKLTGAKTKRLLRDAYDGILPDYITEKRKSGWTTPTGPWMGSKVYDMVQEVLSPDYYPETASLFNMDFIQKTYLSQRKPIDNKMLKQFWPVVSFQIWAKLFNIKL